MSDALNGEGMVPAVNPQGELVRVPQEDFARALAQGFKAPSPEQMQALQAQDAAQGPLQGLAAFGEGLGSALSFGVIPKLETASGLTTPEAIAARKEAHPLAHAAGTGLGIVAPLVLSGGAAAPEEAAGMLGTAASYTAPALIARAGKAAGAAVDGLGLSGVAGSLLPAAATGAVEGGLYAGQDVTEKALLGDPQLTWEKVASEIGLGALFGGALGGAGKGLSDLLPDNLGESMADWLGKTAGTRNLKAAGAIQSDFKRVLKTRSEEALNRIGQEFGERGLVSPLSTPADTLARAKALIEQGAADARALTAAADAAPNAPRFTWGEIRRDVEPDMMARLKSKASSLAAADQLEAEFDKLSTVYGDRPLGFSDLHALRTDVDKLAGYGVKNMDPAVRPVARPLRELRSRIDDLIESGLESAGGNGAAWREAMRKQEVGIVAKEFAEAGLLRSQGNNPVPLTALMGAIAGGSAFGGPLGVVASGVGSYLLREHGSSLAGWAATGAQRRLLQLVAQSDKILSDRAAAIFTGGAGAGAASAAEKFAHGGMVTPERFGEVASALRHYGSNLDALAGQVAQQTATLHDHAPSTAEAASGFAARVVQHLGGKLPDGGQRQALDPQFEPSDSELAAYNRHHSIANAGPAAVLHHLARGTLMREHLETSAALYPKLHAQAQQLVMDKMAEQVAAKKRVPLDMRTSLAMFLGAPVDRATTPQGLLSAQMAYGTPDPTSQQMPLPPQKRARNVEVRMSERLATGSQGNEVRTGAK